MNPERTRYQPVANQLGTCCGPGVNRVFSVTTADHCTKSCGIKWKSVNGLCVKARRGGSGASLLLGHLFFAQDVLDDRPCGAGVAGDVVPAALVAATER